MSDHTDLILYCDGASRGNPGPASVGAVLHVRGQAEPLAEISKAIGRATNNIAEYTALIEGLRRAAEFGQERIEVRMDSELAVKQLHGIYKVKNEGLRPLYQEARKLLAGFNKWSVYHVPREQNKHADRLANLALDVKN